MPIPTIEGLHAWDEQVTLNDRSIDHRVASRYYCDKVSLRNLAEAELIADPAPGRMGLIPRPSVRRGKVATYEGEVQAPTWQDAQAARDELLGALADVGAERQMVITNRDTAEVFHFWAKPVSCETDDQLEQRELGSVYLYACRFVAAFQLSDPRIYSMTQTSAQTATLIAQTGLTLPWTFPIVIPASGEASGTVTVTNPGTAPVDPVVELWGPVTNPRIMNDTLGSVEIRFFGISLAAGSFIRLDFKKRTALLEGTTDIRSRIDHSLSGWWDAGIPGLAPGANVVRYRADTISDPAFALVTFNPAYW